MSRKHLGIVLSSIGLVVLAASLGADFVGVGRYQGFGTDQLLGSVLGAIVLALGAGVLATGAGK